MCCGRHVELPPAIEDLARLHHVAEELERYAHQVVRCHQVGGIPGLLGLDHELFRALAIDAKVAANGVEERERPPDGEYFRRIVELVAQFARPREDRFELRRGPAFHHSQGQSTDHLESELLLLAGRPVRQATQRLQPALGQ